MRQGSLNIDLVGSGCQWQLLLKSRHFRDGRRAQIPLVTGSDTSAATGYSPLNMSPFGGPRQPFLPPLPVNAEALLGQSHRMAFYTAPSNSAALAPRPLLPSLLLTW